MREMNSIDRHHLRGLSDLDVENLRAGRITSVCLLEALRRYVGDFNLDRDAIVFQGVQITERLSVVPGGLGCVCEEINDMIKAANATAGSALWEEVLDG